MRASNISGPLPMRGSCALGASSPGVPLPAMSMGDARPGRVVDALGVTPRHAPQSPSTLGGAPGVRMPFAGFNPMRAGERTFPFAPDPACALATAIHFPTVFVGRPSVPVPCWTRRSRDGWLRFRDPALAPDVWSAVELKTNSAAILPWALRLRAPSGREMCLS
jgi:hypothetical protein